MVPIKRLLWYKNKSGFCGLLADTNNITLLTIGQFIDKIN